MSKKVVGKLKKSMVKIWRISLFLLVFIILPNTIALADNVEGNWTTLASMSTPRDNFQTEVINGKIYTMGGGSFAGIKSTEVYGKCLTSTCIDFLLYPWDNDPYSKNA